MGGNTVKAPFASEKVINVAEDCYLEELAQYPRQRCTNALPTMDRSNGAESASVMPAAPHLRTTQHRHIMAHARAHTGSATDLAVSNESHAARPPMLCAHWHPAESAIDIGLCNKRMIFHKRTLRKSGRPPLATQEGSPPRPRTGSWLARRRPKCRASVFHWATRGR